jgi:hypothetical protein
MDRARVHFDHEHADARTVEEDVMTVLHPALEDGGTLTARAGIHKGCLDRHVSGWPSPMAGEPLSVVVVGAAPRWIAPLVERVNAAARLHEGWDSYGGRPLGPKAAQCGIELLASIGYAGDAPHVVPTPDGNLQLEWTRPDLILQVEVSGGGEVAVLVARGDEVEEWDTGLLGDDRLAALLSWFSR